MLVGPRAKHMRGADYAGLYKVTPGASQGGLCPPFNRHLLPIFAKSYGWGRIRTFVGRSPLVLQTSAFDRSATQPFVLPLRYHLKGGFPFTVE